VIIAWLNLIVSIITAGIFLGIYHLTKKYARSTKEIANRTSDSIEATKEHIRLINEIEKNRLTYTLIKEWLEDKKFLTYKRLELNIYRIDSETLSYSTEEAGKKFISDLNNFLDYFLLVERLINNGNLNKDLYFKTLAREIVEFKENQFEENADITSDIRRKLRENRVSLPVVSDREWFDKIAKIAEEYSIKNK
jgi:hypothetical protein